eukprot:Rmarinus@m.5962
MFPRVGYLLLAFLYNFVLAGALYGWSSLDKMFQEEGKYSWLCEDGKNGCWAQQNHLQFIYTIASSVNMSASVILGPVLDKGGPRLCGAISMASMTAGLALVSFSTRSSDYMLIGMSLYGFGGPGIQNSVMHISNLYPDNRHWVSCFIAGGSQLGFLVFFVFDQVSKVTALGSSEMFLGYAIFTAVQLLIVGCVMPDTPFQPTAEYHQDGDVGEMELLLPGSAPEVDDCESALDERTTAHELTLGLESGRVCSSAAHEPVLDEQLSTRAVTTFRGGE